MGKQMAVDKDSLTPIANQFRNVLEIPSEYQFPLSEFPNMMESALGKTAGENYQQGYDDGKSQGSDEAYWRGYSDGTNNGIEIGKEQGYGEGTENGIEIGKQMSYNEQWDSLQQNGERKDYWGAFCGWRADVFKPKYVPLTIGSGDYMVRGSTITYLPKMILSSGTLNNLLYGARLLETVEEIELAYAVNSATGFVTNCTALINIKFSGSKTINCSINFQVCTQLSHDSIVNIMSYLSDTVSGKTLTLSKVAVDKAFETSEGANDGSTSTEWATLVGTKTNWTISLV